MNKANLFETMFKELINKDIIILEQDEGDTAKPDEGGSSGAVLKLPKFKINEKNWGKTLATEDRAIIERIGAQLKGDDPLARAEYLQRFLTETEQIKTDITVGEVMGTLMFLDIFASIVFEFNASVAGFLFEALFAGIFEGFQIEAKEGGGEAGTTDVILNVRPRGKGAKQGIEYSFKLLTDSNSATIKGSFKDLIDGISKSPDSQETYLVVLKSGTDEVMNLDFYEYDIDQKNWFEWIGVPKVIPVKTYEEKEFEFGSEETPKIVMDNLQTRLDTGKIVDGKFVKKQPGAKKDERDAYEAIEGEEITIARPKKGLTVSPYELRNEAGEAPTHLFTGRKYKMKLFAGTKRTLDYTAGANFNELYKDFLKPDAFSAEVGDKIYTDFGNYVAEGAYKKDPEFFERLKTLGTYTGKGGAGQFKTSAGYMKNQPNVRGPKRLTLDREKFQSAASAYTELVGKQIYEVFTDMANLIEDVSGYYLGGSVKERFEKGYAAKEEAKRLAKSTEKNFKEVEVEEDTRKALEKSAQRRAARRSGYDTGAGKYGGFEESKALDLKDFSKQILETIKTDP